MYAHLSVLDVALVGESDDCVAAADPPRLISLTGLVRVDTAPGGASRLVYDDGTETHVTESRGAVMSLLARA